MAGEMTTDTPCELREICREIAAVRDPGTRIPFLRGNPSWACTSSPQSIGRQRAGAAR
jgi:hypothetical protein